MKDRVERDNLNARLNNILYFEIKTVDLINSFLYLVIRGIYDYTDSYKNNK